MTSSYTGREPKVAITKATVDDGVTGDGLRILSGEPIGWRYRSLTWQRQGLDVTVTDDQRRDAAYVSGDTNDDGDLAADRDLGLEAAGTSIFGDYSNTGTVTAVGNDSAGPPGPPPSPTVGVSGVDPKIAIDKVTVDEA